MTGGSKWILYPMSFLVITILLVNIYLVRNIFLWIHTPVLMSFSAGYFSDNIAGSLQSWGTSLLKLSITIYLIHFTNKTPMENPRLILAVRFNGFDGYKVALTDC